MKPTIGRIVLFRPATAVDLRPACVTKVHDDGTVNLHVLGGLLTGPDGVVEEQGALPTRVGESPEGEQTPRSWRWPPRE